MDHSENMNENMHYHVDNAPVPYIPSGKKCPDCGAYALQKIDGCSRCVSCGFVGACG
jgi:ribonucleoside-diphosphate reductase alpha chain